MGEHLPCKQGVKSSNLSVSIVPIKQLVLTCTLKTSYEKDFDLKINQDIRETNQNVKTFKEFFKAKKQMQRYASKRLSKKERRVDALALRAEERRDKLRKAAVRSKYPMIRRYLNGETRYDRLVSS